MQLRRAASNRLLCIGDFLSPGVLILSLGMAWPFFAFSQSAPPVWGAPANLLGPITIYGIEITPPAIDGQNNAYVLFATQPSYNSPKTVSMVKSQGTTGVWNAPQVIYTIPAPGQGQCFPVVADAAGNVTVFCSLYSSTGLTDVIALRYTPSAGWLAPVTLYEGPQPYNLLAVTDANNDIVLVLGIGASVNTGATCYIYSASAQKWMPPVGIAPLTDKGAAQGYTLRANRTGTAVFFVYLDQLRYSTSLYGQRFNTATLTWEQAQLIPGTAGKKYLVSPAGDAGFPLAVDNSGAARLFFNIPSASGNDNVQVSLYQNGSWGSPTELLRSKSDYFELGYYGAADSNGTESAAAALGFGQNGLITQYFFLYDGSKWTSSTTEQYQSTNSGPLLAFTFTGTGNTAIIEYSGTNNQVFTIRNDGTGWSAPLPPPLGLGGTLTTSSSGRTLLVSGSEVNDVINYYASWLQN